MVLRFGIHRGYAESFFLKPNSNITADETSGQRYESIIRTVLKLLKQYRKIFGVNKEMRMRSEQ